MNGSFPSPDVPQPKRVSLRLHFAAWWAGLKAYFTEQDPKFWTAFAPAFVLSVLIFVRSPLSNYIFDEQEALLANPYVNGQAAAFGTRSRATSGGCRRIVASARTALCPIWCGGRCGT